MARDYRDLIVWQKAVDLVPRVYDLARRLPREERYGLADQLRRSAVSIPANIAEGQGRRFDTEFAQHLGIARGSAAELETLLLLSVKVGHVKAEDISVLKEVITEIRRLLQKLLQTVQTTHRSPSA